MDALRKLARAGDHAVTVHLDRGDAVMIQTLVVPAGWANTQDRPAAPIDFRLVGLRSPSRSWIGRSRWRAIPCGSWLCTVVPGGAAALLATVSGRDDLKRARDWLQDKTATELIPSPMVPQRHGRVLYARLSKPATQLSPTFATSRLTVSCR